MIMCDLERRGHWLVLRSAAETAYWQVQIPLKTAVSWNWEGCVITDTVTV